MQIVPKKVYIFVFSSKNLIFNQRLSSILSQAEAIGHVFNRLILASDSLRISMCAKAIAFYIAIYFYNDSKGPFGKSHC